MRVFLVLSLVLAACNSGDGDPVIFPPPGGSAPPPVDTGDPFDGARMHAVHASDDDGDGDRELFAQTRDGRVLALSAPLGADVKVKQFAVSPDQTRVAFEAEVGGVSRVYVTPVDLANPVPVSVPGEVAFGTVAWAPDGSWLGFPAEGTDGIARLVRTSDDGVDRVTLSGFAQDVVASFGFGGGGSRVLYRTAASVWSVAADGTDGVELAGGITTADFNIAPSGDVVALGVDDLVAGEREVYIRDVFGVGPRTRISLAPEEDGAANIGSLKWFFDESRVMYVRPDAGTGKQAAFVAETDGTGAWRAHAALDAHVQLTYVSPSTPHFAFSAGPRLFAGEAPAQAAEIANQGLLAGVRFATPGDRLTYLAAPTAFDDAGLYVHPIGGVPSLVGSPGDVAEAYVLLPVDPAAPDEQPIVLTAEAAGGGRVLRAGVLDGAGWTEADSRPLPDGLSTTAVEYVGPALISASDPFAHLRVKGGTAGLTFTIEPEEDGDLAATPVGRASILAWLQAQQDLPPLLAAVAYGGTFWLDMVYRASDGGSFRKNVVLTVLADGRVSYLEYTLLGQLQISVGEIPKDLLFVALLGTVFPDEYEIEVPAVEGPPELRALNLILAWLKGAGQGKYLNDAADPDDDYQLEPARIGGYGG